MKNSRRYSRNFRPKEGIEQASGDSVSSSVDAREMPLAAAHRTEIVSGASAVDHPLIRRSMFWPPAYLGESWNEYVPIAFWLVDLLRPKLMVEVGSVSPVSYFALCQAARHLELDAQCIAIDTVATKSRAADIEFMRSYSAQRYHAISSVTSGDLAGASQMFDSKTIDLLHLNLSFTDDATIGENIDDWLSRVVVGGLVLISGTGINTKNISLRKVLSKLRGDYSIFEFTHGIGLSILSIGSGFPSSLANLLKLEPASEANNIGLREVFSRLGQGCADAHSLKLMEEDAIAASRKINELQEFKDNFGKTADEKILGLTAEIDGLRQHAAVMEEELLQSRKAVNEHTLRISTLETELKQVDAMRERQTQELATLTKLLLQAEEKLEKVQGEFAALAAQTNHVGQASSILEKRQRRFPNLLRVFAGNARNSKKEVGGAKFLQAQKLLLGSALFDEKWYVNQYADVAKGNLSPVEHYLTIGASLGYDPSANFDSSYYLSKYQDVAMSGMNPLVHYLRFGISENRKPKAN